MVSNRILRIMTSSTMHPEDFLVELYKRHVAFPKFESHFPPPHTEKVLNQNYREGVTYWSMTADETTPTFKDYFTKFYQTSFENCNSLAVDGVTACGKSSLLSGCTWTKINNFYNLSKENVYNFISFLSLDYIKINEELSTYEGIVTDRSLVSNLTMLLAYYIMDILTNNNIYTRSMFAICEEFVNMFNLKACLNYIRGKKFNVLIMIDSSYDHWAKRTNIRGVNEKLTTDCIKSLCIQYHRAQTAAFAYIANCLHFPCIDLNYVRVYYNIENESAMFETNKEAFGNNMHFPSTSVDVIDIDKELISVAPPILKVIHERAIALSHR